MSEGALSMLDRARRDPAVFAEVLVGQPLWSHQLDVVRSPARYRVICAGRQVGKSRLLAVLALHHAFARAGSTTLLVSAGDTASKRLLEEVAALALASPLLAGSVVDESSQLVTLSNGSTIRSVPASGRQIRGWAVDLLIVDEAGFIDPEVWRAAEPSIIARPESRVLLCSSPWGGADHFFRVMWRRGVDAPSRHLESWHWPSSMSPLVDAQLLEEIAEREEPRYFAREYLAEWTDPTGAYFSPAELEAATAGGVELVSPAEVSGVPAVAGVDWGFSRDASTLAVVAGAEPVAVAAADVDLAPPPERPGYRVAWLEERFATRYTDFIDLVVAAGQHRWTRQGYALLKVVSEANGVGAMPSQELTSRLEEAGQGVLVEPVHTDWRLKEDAFGFVKLLLQQGRLGLPRHPGLLRQLAALEFSQGDGGTVRIAVPERAGHDDLAMALALAVVPLMRQDSWGLGALVPPPGVPVPWELEPGEINWETVEF